MTSFPYSMKKIYGYRNIYQVLKYIYKEKSHWNYNNQLYQISDEVKESLNKKYPVIALESTIISHGMPFPENISTALEVENIIRNYNVTPATIGVINGKIYIGLNKEEMEVLGNKCQNLMKISKRDLPYAISQKLTGGTTVSSTSMIAQKMGIKIFVTGGIGGVHRDVINSMDISSDLSELAHTQITVISAGIKSILDIGKTLEYLETMGVSVVSFGPSKEFPAFFTSRSGYFAPYNVLDANDAANLIVSRDAINMKSGILIAVPIPLEYNEKGQIIEDAIKEAVLEAKEKNIKGKDVTPYILGKVNELTSGESLKNNMILIKNNAVVGSKIALELNKIQLSTNIEESIKKNKEYISKYPHTIIKREKNDKIIVIGGSVLDLVTTVLHDKIEIVN